MEISDNIKFTDITINEADGFFEEVKKIMLKEFPFNNDWVVRSNATIIGPTGFGEMELQFHGNRNVYIIEYSPSVRDLFYNTDIPILSEWLQKKGWKVPEPSFDLIERDKVFWKHFYDSLLIDSVYFDKKYGEREHLKAQDNN